MLHQGDPSPEFALEGLDGRAYRHPGDGHARSTLLVFFESDCPACHLALPYLDALYKKLNPERVRILGISQDDEAATRTLADELRIAFPIVIDRHLSVSDKYDPQSVPTLFLVDSQSRVAQVEVGFDKEGLNRLSAALSEAAGLPAIEIANRFDGHPNRKPGCGSRHLEKAHARGPDMGSSPGPSFSRVTRGSRASRIVLDGTEDPYEYCMRAFRDPLPVVPPEADKVESMLSRTHLAPEEVVALVPPNYGAATVEKIAANAVMAGCRPEMMRVLLTLVRAACDERFNLHGIQATTHFAAPLIIVNGPIRNELGFASGSNLFSNVARANSTLGRALQLILTNLGGARPGEIDMSALGNPGKFSCCIAENEEESPWEPFHVESGFRRDQSALSLFAAEPPRGVSEHTARSGRQVLGAIARALATVWSYRVCGIHEAVVVLCPEHVKTVHRDGLTKADVREFLFWNTGIPVRHFGDGGGEGTQLVSSYVEVDIDGETCYRKFREPDAIKILVAGGTAGKFSAVIGSWATGPRGSQLVTYPVG